MVLDSFTSPTTNNIKIKDYLKWRQPQQQRWQQPYKIKSAKNEDNLKNDDDLRKEDYKGDLKSKDNLQP